MLAEAAVVRTASAIVVMAAGTTLAVAAGSAWTVVKLSLSSSEQAVVRLRSMI